MVAAYVPDALLPSAARRILFRLFCFSLPVGLVIAAIVVILTHRIAGPLYRIERALDDLIEGKEIGPIRLRKNDELRRLSKRINALIPRLKGERDLENPPSAPGNTSPPARPLTFSPSLRPSGCQPRTKRVQRNGPLRGGFTRQEETLVSELNTPLFPEPGGMIEIGIERKHIDFDPEKTRYEPRRRLHGNDTIRRRGSMRAYKTVRQDMDIRFRDIDAMGHVNNAVYFTYFEDGRKVFLEEVFGIVQPSDYPFIMARIECTFKAPLRLGDRPACETWIRDVENRKFSFRYRIIDRDSSDLVYAVGESLMVFYDYSAGRSVPIPSEVKSRIHPYVELPAGDGETAA